MHINTKVVFEWDNNLKQYIETHNEGYEYEGALDFAQENEYSPDLNTIKPIYQSNVGYLDKDMQDAVLSDYFGKDLYDQYLVGNDTTSVDTLSSAPAPADATQLAGPPQGTGLRDMVSDVGDWATSPDNWLTPAIGVGGGAAALKFGRPVGGAALGWSAGGGRFKLKYEVAQQFYEYGKQSAEMVGFDEPRSMGIGGAAAYGGYKAGALALNKATTAISNSLARSIEARVGLGMHSSMVFDGAEIILKTAKEKIAEKEARRQALIKAGKFPRGTVPPKVNAKQIMDKANQQIDSLFKSTKKEVRKHMNKAAKNSWDDVAKAMLKNPKASYELAKFLQKKFPWLAAKLLASTTGLVAPEGISTILGGLGIAWVAYDIYDIMNTYPELGQQIKDIVFGPKTKEAKIMSALTAKTE